MSDVTDASALFAQQRQRTTSTINQGLEDSPDDAARAVELENSTGVPSPIIHADLEGFERQHKTSLVNTLINNNKYLSQFADSHPMAAKVASDDWGQLDKVTQAHEKYGPSTFAIVGDVAKGFAKGFGDQPWGEWAKDVAEQKPFGPAAWTAYTLLGLPIEFTSRLFGAAKGAVEEFGTGVYRQFGGGKTSAKSFGADLGAMFETQLMGLGAKAPHAEAPLTVPKYGRTGEYGFPTKESRAAEVKAQETVAQLTEAIRLARPFLDRGEEPPVGLHPMLDQIKIEQQKIDAKNFDALVQESTASATREKAPSIFANLPRSVDADGFVSIPAEAIRKLYGDKEPAPEDNLLGWVPDINEQLRAAEGSGGDVRIPVADYVARIEKETHKLLGDDIRFREHGITKNEVEEVKKGIEAWHGSPHEFEAFDLSKIGTGEGAQSYGHGLYFAEKKEVAESYKSAGGGDYRFSDAAFDDPDLGPRLRETDIDWQQAQGELDEAEREGGSAKISDAIAKFEKAIKTHELTQEEAIEKYPRKEQLYRVKIHANKEHFLDWDKPLSEQSPEVQAAIKRASEKMPKSGLFTLEPERTLRGVRAEEVVKPETLGQAIYSYFSRMSGKSDDAAASKVLHEAGIPGIKYLDQGSRDLLKIESDLKQANFDLERLKNEGASEHDIGVLEEHIKSLEAQKKEGTHNFVLFDPSLIEILDRNGELISAMRKQAGLEPALVEKPPAGDGGKPPEGDEPAPEKPIFSQGIPKGVSLDQYRRYEKLMNAERVANAERQFKRIQREVARQNSKEWKENYPEALKDAAEEFDASPISRLDDLLRNGILKPDGTKTRIKLDASKLSEAQKASISDRFYGENGIDPDILASELDFASGQQMLDQFAKHEMDRGDTQPKQFRDRQIKDAAAKLMEERYPPRDPIEEAQEHVITPETFDRLHEETVLLGTMAGEELPLNKAEVRRMVHMNFLDSPQSQQTVAKWLSVAGRAGRAQENAFLAGKPTEAFKFAQQKMYAYLYADLAKRQEKKQKWLDKTAKNLSGLPDVNTGLLRGVPTEFLNWIQHMLNRGGRETKRRWDTINEDIQAKEDKTFRDFHQRKNMRGLPEDIEDYDTRYEQSMPVAEEWLDESYRKPIDSMTVEEFNGFHDSIKSLVSNGRKERKQDAEGNLRDLKELISDFTDQLEQNLTEKKIHYNPGLVRKSINLLKQGHASLLQLETIMDRFDLGNPRGLFTQRIMFPLIEAGNDFSRLQRAYSKRVLALEKFNKDVNLNEVLENKLFKDPRNGQFRQMTRANLRAVMLNMGNESNLGKLLKGYKIENPTDLWAWVDEHATKQDWDYVQAVGNIFRDIQKETDLMTRSISETAIQRLPLQDVQTAFGPIPGWYYPLIRDRSRVKGAKEELPMTQEGVKEPTLLPMTSRGFEKARTGAEYPLDLSLSRMNDHIVRRLRDNAFRPTLIETGKIFYNQDFQNAISRLYGEHYTKLLDPYLRNMAGLHGYRSDFVAAVELAGEALRQNVVGVLIGWNPSTPMKHGPTALANSVAEVGVANFAKAIADIYASNDHTGEANWKFITQGGKVGETDWAGSQEIQRRFQHWYETVGGAQDIVLGKLTLRQTLLKYGSYPVAMSDLGSAIPMWWAKYKSTIEESRVERPEMTVEQMHADAVRMADRAVRRAHGSTAITSRPQAVSSFGTMGRFATTLYGFFNHIYQRYYRMAWQINEADRMVKMGDINKSAEYGTQFMKDAFYYVFLPGAVFEALVAAPTEREGLVKGALKGMMHMVTGSVPIIRDITQAVLTGHDPSVGVVTPAIKSLTDPFRDAEGGYTKGWSAERKGKFIKHFLTLSGMATGMTTAQQGRAAEFIWRYNHGLERPKGPWAWAVGLRYGTLKKHSQTFDEWRKNPL